MALAPTHQFLKARQPYFLRTTNCMKSSHEGCDFVVLTLLKPWNYQHLAIDCLICMWEIYSSLGLCAISMIIAIYNLLTSSPGGSGTTGRYSNLHLVVEELVTVFMNEVQEPTGLSSSFTTSGKYSSRQSSPIVPNRTQAIFRFSASSNNCLSL